MVMPTDPTADFVMIQPSFTVAGLEQLFNAMTLPLDTNHLRQGYLGASIGQSVVDPCLADCPKHDQSFLGADTAILLGLDPNHHRIDFQWTLLGIANGHACPPRLGLTLGPSVDPLKRGFGLAAASPLAASRRSSFQVTHQGVAWDVEYIAFLAAAQLVAELRRSTEFVIACNPAMGQARQAPVQQIQRDPPLLLELNFRGHMAFQSAFFVGRPILGQVELAVQRAITRRGGISQEHTDLAVVQFSQPAAPLTADATGFRPFLGEGAGVDNHHAIRACQFLADMGGTTPSSQPRRPTCPRRRRTGLVSRQAGLDGNRLAGFASKPLIRPRMTRVALARCSTR